MSFFRHSPYYKPSHIRSTLAILFTLGILLSSVLAPVKAFAAEPKAITPTYTEQREIESYATVFRKAFSQYQTHTETGPIDPALVQKYGVNTVAYMICYKALSADQVINGFPGPYVENNCTKHMEYHHDTRILTLDITWYSSPKNEQSAYQTVQNIVKTIPLSGNRVSRLQQLSEYIISHYSYDMDKHPSSDSFAYVSKHHQNKLMCGGYSQLLYLMAKAAGISGVSMQDGSGWKWADSYGLHSWNTVTDESGKQYVLDLTTAWGHYNNHHFQTLPDYDLYLLPEGTQNYKNRIPYFESGVYHIPDHISNADTTLLKENP